MPSSENKIMLTTQTEKPSHYRYLKEFRVEQCPLFPQHKCTQHRPFSCFNWHFPNQKRRRPIRKKDGTFNYSPDAYCTKYDETNGVCPDGDDCPLLHRTAGDTERRYHLRYFKTCMCIYETDTRGFCTKNGAHCAFAHGEIDKRPPVFDIRELQQMQAAEQPVELQDPVLINGPNQLDKERNMMVDDPKWQDANYVLIHYKTESCKRPPRLCRQGYACPQYHNLRDRRRSPKKHKYRSTPCPNVKHGDEWGEPTQCEDGDECAYCHTRTEQQFHPEIYKSSKCHDVFANQYCPRGPFCAFAHADHEMTINRNLPTDTNFGEILSNALPNSLGNGNNGGMEESNNNFINIQGLNNNSNNVDIFNMASINNLLAKNNGGGSDMSDMRGSSPDSISQFQQLMGGTSTNSASFGNQSFASAVSYSAAAGNNNINISKLFGETSGDKSGMDDLNSLSNGLARSIGNRINHMSGNNFNMTGSTLFENLDNFMNFEQDREIYSLFPSMSAAKNPREESRDESPNAEKENADGSEFGSSDISLASGASSKPVSIPGSFFPRERFPSGSPLTKTMNTINTINNPLSTFFKNPESLEHSTDVMNNHLGWEFSPRSLTMSPLTNNSGFNIVQQQQQQQTSSGTLGALTSITSSISTTSNNNNISGGNGMNNGSNSNNVNVAPIGSNTNNNNGGGGSSSGMISDSNNGLISGSNNSTSSSIVSANGTMINILGRSDLSYISLSLLNQYAKAFREQLDAINNAITSYNKESPHYPCLNCKIKDKARTIVLVPCDHQVLCVNCAPNVNYCPLCRTVIRNRKQASIITSEL